MLSSHCSVKYNMECIRISDTVCTEVFEIFFLSFQIGGMRNSTYNICFYTPFRPHYVDSLC